MSRRDRRTTRAVTSKTLRFECEEYAAGTPGAVRALARARSPVNGASDWQRFFRMLRALNRVVTKLEIASRRFGAMSE